MALNKGKIITITSVKGGTGKTTTTLNLAGIYSEMKKKVLIIDFDLYSGGIAASLNINNDIDIFKLVMDISNNSFTFIENYIVKYSDSIDVIPCPKDPRLANKVSCKYIQIILNKVSPKYDIILIDTNHFLNDVNLMLLDVSDSILYLLSNDPIDLKNMKSMVSILKNIEKDNFKIVLNESIDRNRSFFSKYDIKNIIKDNIDYIIPNSFYLKNIDKYTLDGKILTLDKKIKSKHKKVIKNFKNIATSLIKEKKKAE